GGKFVLVHAGAEVRRHNLATGNLQDSWPKIESEHPLVMAPHGEAFATTPAGQNTTLIRSTASGEAVYGVDGFFRPSFVAFSPDARWVAAGAWTQITFTGPPSRGGRYPDQSRDAVSFSLLRDLEAKYSCMAFCPSGDYVATATEQGTVSLWPFVTEPNKY